MAITIARHTIPVGLYGDRQDLTIIIELGRISAIGCGQMPFGYSITSQGTFDQPARISRRCRRLITGGQHLLGRDSG